LARRRRPKELLAPALKRTRAQHWFDRFEREREAHEDELLARLAREKHAKPAKKERARR